MPVRRPSPTQMRELAERLYLNASDDDLRSFRELMEGSLRALDSIESLPEGLPETRYPRTSGHQPSAEENPLNAWYVKSEVPGADDGPLAGRTVALKDNVCLAGVPMMNGASTLEGYVPEIDATLVTRLLDAGATIVGKAHCEYFCLSGGSHTNATGAVHNPHRHGYSAGGSSSGSAALVAAGEVDMAIGGDQGGSIRIPASYCGVYGMKATHGLVPYTGVMPIENTIDHAGPITANVEDNALMLEVIAGPDGLDPRQIGVQTARYSEAIGAGAAELRIGVVEEGFGLDESLPGVDSKVRDAASRLRDLGAKVETVAVPMHSKGPAIWSAIGLEGLTVQMMHANGFGMNWEGLYLPSLMKAHSRWRDHADDLSETLKLSMFTGEWMNQCYGGAWYAKGQNLARRLRAAYDEALAKFDLLLMPTLPMVATPIPDAYAPREEIVARAFEMIPNTAPFDVTGHPAMSLPCGLEDGLPVGLMLIGRHWDEATIYRAAHAFEQSGDWKSF
ncbi:MAG: amidase [Myxococcales bacterium]|nr:amidase [Myxococcales bacterium]